MAELMPLVYSELKHLARSRLRHESPSTTLSTTALAHEAYVKLVDQRRVQWNSRAHFYAIASISMRRVLVNAARAPSRLKRGGGTLLVSLGELAVGAPAKTLNIVILDDALNKLEAVSEPAPNQPRTSPEPGPEPSPCPRCQT